MLNHGAQNILLFSRMLICVRRETCKKVSKPIKFIHSFQLYKKENKPKKKTKKTYCSEMCHYFFMPLDECSSTFNVDSTAQIQVIGLISQIRSDYLSVYLPTPSLLYLCIHLFIYLCNHLSACLSLQICSSVWFYTESVCLSTLQSQHNVCQMNSLNLLYFLVCCIYCIRKRCCCCQPTPFTANFGPTQVVIR